MQFATVSSGEYKLMLMLELEQTFSEFKAERYDSLLVTLTRHGD